MAFEPFDSLIGFLAYYDEYFENYGEFFLVGFAFVLLFTFIKCGCYIEIEPALPAEPLFI